MAEHHRPRWRQPPGPPCEALPLYFSAHLHGNGPGPGRNRCVLAGARDPAFPAAFFCTGTGGLQAVNLQPVSRASQPRRAPRADGRKKARRTAGAVKLNRFNQSRPVGKKPRRRRRNPWGVVWPRAVVCLSFIRVAPSDVAFFNRYPPPWRAWRPLEPAKGFPTSGSRPTGKVVRPSVGRRRGPPGTRGRPCADAALWIDDETRRTWRAATTNRRRSPGGRTDGRCFPGRRILLDSSSRRIRRTIAPHFSALLWFSTPLVLPQDGYELEKTHFSRADPAQTL